MNKEILNDIKDLHTYALEMRFVRFDFIMICNKLILT